MLGQTQIYIILAVGILLFGGSIVSKGVKSFYKTKREVETIIKEETTKNEKESVVVGS